MEPKFGYKFGTLFFRLSWRASRRFLRETMKAVPYIQMLRSWIDSDDHWEGGDLPESGTFCCTTKMQLHRARLILNCRYKVTHNIKSPWSTTQSRFGTHPITSSIFQKWRTIWEVTPSIPCRKSGLPWNTEWSKFVLRNSDCVLTVGGDTLGIAFPLEAHTFYFLNFSRQHLHESSVVRVYVIILPMRVSFHCRAKEKIVTTGPRHACMSLHQKATRCESSLQNQKCLQLYWWGM